MAKEWRDVPSVTTGGKPSFYTRFTPLSRAHPDRRIKETVVWDRGLEEWAYLVEDMGSGRVYEAGMYPSAKEAMRAADAVIDEYKREIAREIAP